MPILELGNPRFGEGKGGAQEAVVPAVTLASLLLPAPQPLGPGGRVLGVSRPQFYLLQKWDKKVSHMRWSQEISAFQAVKLFPGKFQRWEVEFAVLWVKKLGFSELTF